MTTDQLTRVLGETLDAVTPPPPPELATVRTEARRVARRRRTTVAVVTVGAVAAGWFGAYQLADGAGDIVRPDSDIAVPGDLDTTDGLRAVAAPGVELHIGGTRVPLVGGTLPYLDTDAAATQYGVLWPDEGGIVHLLDADGDDRIVSGSSESLDGWHPTIKVDNVAGHAAWATLDDRVATVSVHDLAADGEVASAEITCGDACDELVIEALDEGHVVVRLRGDVFAWDYRSDTSGPEEWQRIAGPGTRIADLRNGVLLHAGAAPDALPAGWTAVSGPVDGQLTFDGAHIVAWDRVLTPTLPDGEPVRLDVRGAIFYTVDTDGSVMAATLSPTKVFDCDVPSGTCEQFATLPDGAGDPMFIGNDM